MSESRSATVVKRKVSTQMRLRQIREQAGLSQQDLQKKSGVSQHAISEIELAKRKPQGRTLRKLAAALGVTVADFFEDETPTKALSRSPEWAGTSSDKEFQRAVMSADPATLLLYMQNLNEAVRAAGEDRDERERLLERTGLITSALMRNVGPIRPGPTWGKRPQSEEARALRAKLPKMEDEEETKAG